MTAPNVEAPSPIAAGRAQDQTTSGDAIVSDLDANRKEFARLQASAARGGFVVHELADGAFLLVRWGREVPSLHALAVALRQMGVSA